MFFIICIYYCSTIKPLISSTKCPCDLIADIVQQQLLLPVVLAQCQGWQICIIFGGAQKGSSPTTPFPHTPALLADLYFLKQCKNGCVHLLPCPSPLPHWGWGMGLPLAKHGGRSGDCRRGGRVSRVHHSPKPQVLRSRLQEAPHPRVGVISWWVSGGWAGLPSHVCLLPSSLCRHSSLLSLPPALVPFL